MSAAALEAVERDIVGCSSCPRLVAFREAAGEDHWARPVPGFGDPEARIYVLGLAPSAHGGNRVGRAFTGNPTADWLIAAMHAVGLANQPTSRERGDGLRLHGAWMGSAVRCAPPANRPTAAERDRCLPFLRDEVTALPRLRVIVALGGFAWDAVHRAFAAPPRPRFGHGAVAPLTPDLSMVASFHPSRQNTNTGKLRPGMLESVLRDAMALAHGSV